MGMHALGVDFALGGPVRTVVVDGGGRILQRSAGDDPQRPAVTIDAVGFAVDHEHPAEAGMGSFRLPFESASAPGVHHCDAGAAAVVAEAWIGAARGAAHAICLSIGDRVLAGILLNGQPWLGAHGLAGAAAWLALNPVERQDYRKYGSLAAEVGNQGIARRLSWRIQAGDDSAVLEKAGTLDAITAAHVFDGARAGDGVSISVVRDTAKYVGMAVATLAATLDPEIVVLAGTIAAAGDLMLDPVRQEVARRLPPAMAAKVRVEISPLGDDGVAIGAARLAMLARP